MAAIASNPVINGFRGKLGDALVFKTMRGKTFVSLPARKPDKRKESEAQHNTRVSFKQAAEWAQGILLDPEQKAYYQKRARALKLPNAYTAALTDYMRKASIVKRQCKGTMSYTIAKRGFNVKEVRVAVEEGMPAPLVVKNRGDHWLVQYTINADTPSFLTLIVTDNSERVMNHRV